MSDVAIRVEGLGKQYRIAHSAGTARYRTLREDLLRLPRQAWAALRGNGQRHETFWALKDVSFEVQQGEVLGIIGRNGAGKSTLLKILARITEPTTGQAEVYGRVGSLLEVGTGFHPELTGRENIFLSGAVLGMTRREVQRKFDEIVAFAEVEQFLDTPAKHYSSGMYMRLAFAVAAHLEPEILLVDEVLAVGDAEFQKKCLGKMGEVARAGRTVLFVSHNMAAVQRLCPASLWIHQGDVVAQGESGDVVRRYLSDTVATRLEWRRTGPAVGAAYFDRVFVADTSNKPVSAVATGDQIRVGLEFVVRSAPRNLQVSIGLLDGQSGEVIFASSPQDSGLQPPEAAGHYRAFVELPPDVFMPRDYAIRTVLWTPEIGTVDRLDALSFSTHSTPSLSNSTPGGRLGLIALRCPWTLQRVQRLGQPA